MLPFLNNIKDKFVYSSLYDAFFALGTYEFLTVITFNSYQSSCYRSGLLSKTP
nr:hypothetical protein Q903MT_gene6018 [Picea sitchensis]